MLLYLAYIVLFVENRTCPKSDPRFQPLVQRVTQNFDTFEDFGDSPFDAKNQGGQRVLQKNVLDQFYNYDYRRVRKPRVPLPDMVSPPGIVHSQAIPPITHSLSH
jgi:hypothetical protein